eukprot:2148304-Rhodomonas_salina.1
MKCGIVTAADGPGSALPRPLPYGLAVSGTNKAYGVAMSGTGRDSRATRVCVWASAVLDGKTFRDRVTDADGNIKQDEFDLVRLTRALTFDHWPLTASSA